MKKLLVVALSALLLLALFIPVMADEAPKFTTTVSASKVKRGEEVTVTVAVDKTIASLKTLALDYSSVCDPAVFEWVSGSFSPAVQMKLPVAQANPGTQAVCMGMMPASDVSGEIFSFTLKAKTDAAFGTYNFEVVVKMDTVEQATVGTAVEVYHDCVPAADYTKDGDNHWKECTVSGCTVAPTKEGHTYNGTCGDTCTVCGHPRVVTHNFTKQNKDADYHWNECADCGKIDESSKAAHTPKAEDVLVSPADCANAAVYKKVCSVCDAQIGNTFSVGTPDASQHAGGTATCKDKAVCMHCSQPYGDVNPDNHTGNKRVNKNATQHWEECESCGAEIANTRVAHSGGTANCKDLAVCSCGQAYGELDLTTHKGGKANCANKAICEVCGDPYGDLDPNVHTGNVTVLPEEPATCKKEGKTEEISCKDCGAVLTPSTPIEKEPHYVSEWTVTTPATVDSEGEKKGKCDVCGDEFTVTIAKLVASIDLEDYDEEKDGKVESVGEPSIPADTQGVYEQEEITDELKEAVAAIDAAKGKDILYAAFYAVMSQDTYVDAATGEEIFDETAINTKLPYKVKITLPVKADLANYENFVVLTSDLDTDEDIAIQATVENGMIVFETDYFFNAIVLVGNAKKVNPDVPQNGDASQVAMFAALAVISSLSLGAIYVSKKAKASK